MTENANPTDEEQVEAVNADAESSTPEATEKTEPVIAKEEITLDVELEAVRAEAKKNLEKWQRVLADFDNYKKRVERERVDVRDNATADVIKSVLPVIDDFERAVENIPEELKGNPWVDGTTAISRKLQKLLENNDIDVIDPVGQPFDPDRHQGLGVDENTDVEPGHVTVTLQKGYSKGDRVLRPALVRIAADS